ncbi:hypothetical protein JCM11251_005955 [Rhodosporidiobolus azoricus]
MNPPEPGHTPPLPSTASPTSLASHAPSSSHTGPTASVTSPALSRQGKQLAFVVPASSGSREGQSGDGSPLFPTDQHRAEEYVRGVQGVRQPSYGPLGSAPEAQGDKLRRDAFASRANGGVGRSGVEERLEKRPRARERRSAEGLEWKERLQKRQWPYAEGYPYCGNVGNDVLSCFPETDTTLVQGDYSKFIWNSRYPTFIGAGAVDVYLYNADTDDVAATWLNRTNPEGMISILPEDQWWADPAQSTDLWFGDAAQNRSIPYYFVVVDGGSQLTGGEEHQATFDVVQTAPPQTLLASLAALTSSSLSSASSASSASAASASSLASLSSAGLILSTLSDGSTVTLSPSGTGFVTLTSSLTDPAASSSSRGGRGSGDLQNDSGSGTSIPKYAIALIVIFGFLALVAGAVAVYFCLGRARRRRRAEDEAARAREADDGFSAGGDDLTHGSQDPILGGGGIGTGGRGTPAGSMSQIGGTAGPGSSFGALSGLAAGAGLGAVTVGGRGRDDEDDEGTVSRSDAARMAEAFRAALRKPPEFPAVPSADDSPSSEVAAGLAGPGAGPSPTGAPGGDDSGESGGRGRALVEDELKSEGRSMKSVEGGGGKRWGRQPGSG